MNVRGCPDTEGSAVGPGHRCSVGAVVVVVCWEGQPHGEERQSARSIHGKVTDENGGIVAMNVGEMQRSLSRKAEREPKHQFGDLYSLLGNMNWLRLAHAYVAQNAGSKTAGCDGLDMY